MGVSSPLDRLSFKIASHRGAVATTASGAVVQTIDIRPAPPEPGYHIEARIAAKPSPPPTWAPGDAHRYGLPVELVIAAATVGVIVAWHVRRAGVASVLSMSPGAGGTR